MVRYAFSFSALLAAASALPLSMHQLMPEQSAAPVIIDMMTPEPMLPMLTPPAATSMMPGKPKMKPPQPMPSSASVPVAKIPSFPNNPTPPTQEPAAPRPAESMPATSAPALATPDAQTAAPADPEPARAPAAQAPIIPTPPADTGSLFSPIEEPSMGPEASVEPPAVASPTPTNAPVCFPASASVTVSDGSKKAMSQLQLGDRVAVGGGLFSEVFMFTHRIAEGTHDFVKLDSESGASLRLTAGHFLPINGRYVPASAAKIGDLVQLANGLSSRIVSIESVKDTGLYNPQTAHGDIVVDGIRASTYTTAVEPRVAHALLAPLRAACDAFGVRARFLEAGADRAARFVSTLA